jgi:hypothetical protein
MPKIFEYLGIVIFFYSDDHEPIHIHARYGDTQSKAEFIIKDGKIIEIVIKPINGWDMLKNKDLKNFNEFLKVYADKIVEKWIDFFVLKKRVTFEKITKRLR